MERPVIDQFNIISAILFYRILLHFAGQALAIVKRNR